LKKVYTKISLNLLKEFLKLPDDINIEDIQSDYNDRISGTVTIFLSCEGLPERAKVKKDGRILECVNLVYETKYVGNITHFKKIQFYD